MKQLYSRRTLEGMRIDPATAPAGTYRDDVGVYVVKREGGTVSVSFGNPLGALPNFLTHVTINARRIAADSEDPAHVREAKDLLDAVERVLQLPSSAPAHLSNERDMALVELGRQIERTNVQGALGGEVGRKVLLERGQRKRNKGASKGGRRTAENQGRSRMQTDASIATALTSAIDSGTKPHKLASTVARELRITEARVRQAPSFDRAKKTAGKKRN